MPVENFVIRFIFGESWKGGARHGEVPMKHREQFSYKDFLMWADSERLADSGEWRATVRIRRKNSDTIKSFAPKETFKTEEEAI